MTDERLRDLERSFKESGSPEDEVAWLQARVRAGERLDWESYSRLAELNVEAAADYLRARVERGELSQETLELAGQLGDPVAGEFLPPRPATPTCLEALAALPEGQARLLVGRTVSRLLVSSGQPEAAAHVTALLQELEPHLSKSESVATAELYARLPRLESLEVTCLILDAVVGSLIYLVSRPDLLLDSVSVVLDSEDLLRRELSRELVRLSLE